MMMNGVKNDTLKEPDSVYIGNTNNSKVFLKHFYDTVKLSEKRNIFEIIR